MRRECGDLLLGYGAGTYLGLVQKLDYLQQLGINAIELQPVQEFNELEYYEVGPSWSAVATLISCIYPRTPVHLGMPPLQL